MKGSFRRTCGNCGGFQKVNGFGETRGFCESFDCRTGSDCICKHWFGIKYKRVKKHNSPRKNKGSDYEQP